MDGQKFIESEFRLEEDFEKVVKNNSKTIFGSRTIYFDLKNKIDSKTLGATIPDGFLFDFKDINNPEFYLVEVELEKHDFDRHIFPQIKKFFSFFKNDKSRNELTEKLFNFIKSNKTIEDEFNLYLGKKEVYKTLKDIIESSQNILLIIDELKPQFEETADTITEWAKFVKVEVLKQFVANGKSIFVLNPDFEDVGAIDLPQEPEEKNYYSEEFHKNFVDKEIINVYEKIKKEILDFDPTVKINPQKYYISFKNSGNFAFIRTRRRKLHITIMLPLEIGKKKIHHHKITELAPSVQKFYNGPCFRVTIEKDFELEEVISLLKGALGKEN